MWWKGADTVVEQIGKRNFQMGFDNEQISHDHVATFTKEEDISSRHGSQALPIVRLGSFDAQSDALGEQSLFLLKLVLFPDNGRLPDAPEALVLVSVWLGSA